MIRVRKRQHLEGRRGKVIMRRVALEVGLEVAEEDVPMKHGRTNICLFLLPLETTLKHEQNFFK